MASPLVHTQLTLIHLYPHTIHGQLHVELHVQLQHIWLYDLPDSSEALICGSTVVSLTFSESMSQS